ncbi:hypothetical protein DACRYDRAFT_119923 [Dacryopinax primogenitus]|uniref:2-hydroxyacid dehydrogenase n=1 Tax=Dacryopinax primogenitus (strain DJM 731) TaxID=1858805 RepID=M5FU24_DACPD|nr:uncharacterized protein DACRYDRAFT_119923 [Dacryopinax primogenitus]EJT96706.1 hypothetical protein DACRYDRAFT_119923 [Dacryopinax primogenitus]
MSRPKILVSGHIAWANKEVYELLEPFGDIVWLDGVPTRNDFKNVFLPQHPNIVGIYRHNSSSDRIGVYDKELVDMLPSSVKFIAHNGAGYDQIDVAACRARGIQVSNTPGAVDTATATTALYLLISCFRQFAKAELNARARNWKNGLLPAHDPDGKILGIVGYGGIGGVLAQRCRDSFGMKVIYYNPRPRTDAPAWAEYRPTLVQLLKEADVVSLHCPLREETRGLIGATEFEQMKKGAILINTARGAVVDEKAMIGALKSGHLYAAGLDVYPSEPHITEELYSFPNVTLLPHMGTETEESQKSMEVAAMKCLVKAFETGEIGNRVA